MIKVITIRTDEATFKDLEALARTTARSRNYLANEALKSYLERRAGRIGSDVPVVTDASDLAADFWPEDDIDAFRAYHDDEREQSLEDDRRLQP